MVSFEQGMWKPHTASINWCEADYAHSLKVVEFWNTASAFPMVFVGAIAVRDARRASASGGPVVSASFLVLIGLGTAAFHGTLQYSAQMLDEIPMFLSLFVGLVSLAEAWLGESSVTLRMGAAIYCLGFSLLHCACGFTTLFQVHVAVVVAAFVVGASVIVYLIGPNPQHGFRQVHYQLASYVGTLLLAVLVWVMEETMCPALQSIPWGNPQLHAWWHVLISVAYYKGVMLPVAIQDQLQDASMKDRFQALHQLHWNHGRPGIQGLMGLQGPGVPGVFEICGIIGLKVLQEFKEFHGFLGNDTSKAACDGSCSNATEGSEGSLGISDSSPTLAQRTSILAGTVDRNE